MRRASLSTVMCLFLALAASISRRSHQEEAKSVALAGQQGPPRAI